MFLRQIQLIPEDERFLGQYYPSPLEQSIWENLQLSA